jgi:hypothetical protein
MKSRACTKIKIYSFRLLSIVLPATLLHSQMSFGQTCDLPMFSGARLFGAGSQSQMFVTADLNHDGIADLAVINVSSNNVSILLGNGDGTFQSAKKIATGIPTAIAAADFNGDGNIDLAISDHTSFKIMVMLGNGDGTFRPGIPASSQTGNMAVGDFNKDGKLDLALDGTPAYILLGNGDGTFQALIQPAGNPFIPGEGVAVGDFNGDGKLDVVTGGPSGVCVMLGDGRGNLSAPAVINVGGIGTINIGVGDLNGDQKPDVVALDPFGNNIFVLLGKGDGTFQPPVGYSIPGIVPSANVLVADLTGDGVPDLAISSQPPLPNGSLPVQLPAPGTIFVFPGLGDGTFQTPLQYNPAFLPVWWMAAGDFNGDGLTDVVFSTLTNIPNAPTSVGAQIGLMLGNPDGTLQSPKSYLTGDLPRSPVLADFNGDGVLDLAVMNAGFNNPSMSVLLGNPDGSFQSAVNYPTAFGAASVAAGDVNGDGKVDLVVGNGSAGNLLTFLGNGDGSFQAPVASSASFGANFVALGDFNSDGKLDAVIVNAAKSLQILTGNGNGTFSGNFNFFGMCLGCGGGNVAVADFNGDGKLDLVAANSNITTPNGLFGSGTITVFLGNGNGSFQNGVNYTIGLNAVFVAVVDLNGDGKPDLAVADYGGNPIVQPNPGALAVLLGNGDGTFRPAVRYSAPLASSVVVTADFNGDGFADVAVAASTGGTVATLTTYLTNPDGTLRNALTYGSGGSPLGMTVGDVNGDGKPDLVFVDDVANTMQVMLNNYIPGGGVSACTAVQVLSN